MSEYPTSDSDGGYRRRFSMDWRGASVTYILIGVNVLLFLVINGLVRLGGMNESAVITQMGAKDNQLIAMGQYWRLFTCMFLHSEPMHLFFNCYALFVWGQMVEKLYGRWKYIALYIVAGLIGSLASYIWSPYPSLGASGAIFGLLGGLLYFRQKWKEAFRRFFGPSLFIIIGFNLFYGFTNSGIDNWAHIGGLVGGFLAGNALGLYGDRKARADKALFTVGIIALCVFGMFIGYRLNLGGVYRALDAGDYDTALAEVSQAVDTRHDDLRVINAVADVFIDRINYYGKIGDIASAKAEADKLVSWYPDEADFQRIRTQVYGWGE